MEQKMTNFFNENIGLSLGLNMVNLDNKLRIQKTDTSFDSYENLALIPNITLGISGKIFNSQSLHFYYETGINFVPGYSLEMQYANQSSDPPDLNAEGMALGVYGTTGVNLKLSNLLYFQTALSYSFIPVELEYTNWEKSAKIDEKTIVQPDNLVICGKPENDAYLTKAPVLIFEILSKSTATKDRVTKYHLYENEGVLYYIIVDPVDSIAKIYKLNSGKYIKVKDASNESIEFDIETCKFTFDFSDIWK